MLDTIVCMTAAWRMWALAAAFYLVAIFHRMSLGVASLGRGGAVRGLDEHDRAALDGAARRLPGDADPGGAAGRPARAAAVADARAAGDGRRRAAVRVQPVARAGDRRPRAGRRRRRLHVPQRPARRGALASAPSLRARRRVDRGVRRVRSVAQRRRRSAPRCPTSAGRRRSPPAACSPPCWRSSPSTGCRTGRTGAAATRAARRRLGPTLAPRLAGAADAPRPVGALRADGAVRDADRAVGVPVPGAGPGPRPRDGGGAAGRGGARLRRLRAGAGRARRPPPATGAAR